MKKQLLNESIKLDSFYQGRALQQTISTLLWIVENAEDGEIKEKAISAISEYQEIIKENFDKKKELFIKEGELVDD